MIFKKQKISFFITAFLSIFTAFSCRSTAQKAAEKIDEYEMISVEDSSEAYEMSAQFPKFISTEYKILNEAVEDYHNMRWNSFMKDAVPYWFEINSSPWMMGNPFQFSLTGTVYSGKNTVSVIEYLDEYVGGAHGNYLSKTFCFSKEQQKLLDITEATGLTLEEISSACRKDLLKDLYSRDKDYTADDWFYNGTSAESENFSKFYINGNTVTILFDPYDIAAYVYGAFSVDIKL